MDANSRKWRIKALLRRGGLYLFWLAVDSALINLGFFASYLLRYNFRAPGRVFSAYLGSAPFLTLIYITTFWFTGLYKNRFRSSLNLFKKSVIGITWATLLAGNFLYFFRSYFGAFPSSVLLISFVINLLCIYEIHRFILRKCNRISRRVLVVGKGQIEQLPWNGEITHRVTADKIQDITYYYDFDEVIISELVEDEKQLNFVTHLTQRLRTPIFYSGNVYLKLIHDRVNGNNSLKSLSTIFGRKSDSDELRLRILDIAASVTMLLLALPAIGLTAVIVKLTSRGAILYRQPRIGKDGKNFTLYKFRTMFEDAEKYSGPVLASKDDPRVTKVGRILRRTRLDELPQLFNIIKGDMSLVGPRPERPHFVRLHKALRELRLTVKPGLTGLAQIRGFYDLQPRHKIKYDYLYIQRRSLSLNLYILARTIPVLLSKKGW